MRFAVLVVALLAGCATQQDWYWYKAGASDQEMLMDHGQCRAQAFSVPGGSLMQAALVLDGCMAGKGWQRVAR